jgi:hypothetical protein
VIASIPEKGTIYRVRIYLIGNRVYRAAAVGQEAFAVSEETNRFLDSFQRAER